MRRLRERQRDGTVLAKLAIPAEVAEDLVKLGWLRRGGTPDEVRAALVDLATAALELGLRRS